MNSIQFSQEDQIIKSAISDIKNAITQSQSRALKIISGEQLSLYYGVGLYVSKKTRSAQWGTNAIQKISEGLQKELPGLRGFSSDNIKKMRQFAEFWEPYLSNRLTLSTDLISIDYFSMQKWIPNNAEINREEFLSISFSHHIAILAKTKQIEEILFYINQTVCHSWDVRKLRAELKSDIYKISNNQAINNFAKTISPTNSLPDIDQMRQLLE